MGQGEVWGIIACVGGEEEDELSVARVGMGIRRHQGGSFDRSAFMKKQATNMRLCFVSKTVLEVIAVIFRGSWGLTFWYQERLFSFKAFMLSFSAPCFANIYSPTLCCQPFFHLPSNLSHSAPLAPFCQKDWWGEVIGEGGERADALTGAFYDSTNIDIWWLMLPPTTVAGESSTQVIGQSHKVLNYFGSHMSLATHVLQRTHTVIGLAMKTNDTRSEKSVCLNIIFVLWPGQQ